LALLIDGDNAQPDLFNPVLSAIQTLGQVIVKRVYGNLNSSKLQKWKKLADDNDMHPTTSRKYTGAKNETDWHLGLDAVTMVDEHKLDGVCIMSSDRDYITLATTIMKRGKFVVMIGRESSRKAFTSQNIYYVATDNNNTNDWKIVATKVAPPTPKSQPTAKATPPPAPKSQPTAKATPPPAPKAQPTAKATPPPAPKPQPTAKATPPPAPAKPAPSQSKPTPTIPPKASNTVSQRKISPKEALVCKTVFATVVGTNGWGNLSQYASALRNSGFNHKSLGHGTILKFVKAYPNLFEVKLIKAPKAKGSAHYIRLKATL
jgi:hypothetical protein